MFKNIIEHLNDVFKQVSHASFLHSKDITRAQWSRQRGMASEQRMNTRSAFQCKTLYLASQIGEISEMSQLARTFFKMFFESLTDPRYVWKSSRRDLFKSAIFLRPKSVKKIFFCRSSSTFSEFSVLTMCPSLVYVGHSNRCGSIRLVLTERRAGLA